MGEKTASGTKLKTGRIVGIIKRNWRQYCGMLQQSGIKGVSHTLNIMC